MVTVKIVTGKWWWVFMVTSLVAMGESSIAVLVMTVKKIGVERMLMVLNRSGDEQ